MILLYFASRSLHGNEYKECDIIYVTSVIIIIIIIIQHEQTFIKKAKTKKREK